MKFNAILAAVVAVVLWATPAWAERIRLDCPYRGTGAILFDRPFGDGSLSFLVDEESRTVFIMGSGDWHALIVDELSPVRIFLRNPGYLYDISRTTGAIRISWQENESVTLLGNGTCQRVAEAPRKF